MREEGAIVATAELPWLSKEDLEVNITENLLVRAEKKKEEEVEEESYFGSERSYGAFMRGIKLPRGGSNGYGQATFKNSILEVRIPLADEVKRTGIRATVEKPLPTQIVKKTACVKCEAGDSCP